jgi:hypothetical protein
VVFLLAVACDDTEFPTDAGGTFEGDSYADVVQIFDAHCVSCHRSSGPVAGLDLESDPCEAIVGVASSRTDPYVVPGDREASVLWHRVADTGQFGVLMPPGSMAEANVDTIGAWIDAGASCSSGGGA